MAEHLHDAQQLREAVVGELAGSAGQELRNHLAAVEGGQCFVGRAELALRVLTVCHVLRRFVVAHARQRQLRLVVLHASAAGPCTH